ncbi:MAG TPA: siphovirus Gp157 family protein [Bryobacteraceae bacterium]|nr:siphovirus Gp157 family protein [Bryobacteraceae bacterium]
MPHNEKCNRSNASAEAETPTTIASTLTLFQVEQSLVLLAESAEEDGLTTELEQALVRYMEGAVEKRDRVAEFILFCEGMAGLAKSEVKRLQARQKHFEATGERVSAMVLRVLDFLGVTRLEGKTHTLKKRKCPASVKIIEEEKIPAAYKRITLTLPLPDWQALVGCIAEDLQKVLVASIRRQEISLDLEAIKQALNMEEKIDGADLVVNKFTLQVG